MVGKYLTYEDIPDIMQGKMPFIGKTYVYRLPNGRYTQVTDYGEGLEDSKNAALSQLRGYPNFGKTESEMTVWVRFNLHSEKEATDYTLADKICERFKHGTWWTCLGSVGGVGYYDDNGDLVTVLSCPKTKELREFLANMD